MTLAASAAAAISSVFFILVCCCFSVCVDKFAEWPVMVKLFFNYFEHILGVGFARNLTANRRQSPLMGEAVGIFLLLFGMWHFTSLVPALSADFTDERRF